MNQFLQILRRTMHDKVGRGSSNLSLLFYRQRNRQHKGVERNELWNQPDLVATPRSATS